MRFNILWRLVGLLALLAYVVLAFLLARLVVHNIGFSIVLCSTALFLVYAVWLLFAGSGHQSRKGRWYLGAGLAALAAELVYFVRNVSSLRAAIGFLALTAFYLVLTGYLRQKYWSEERRAAQLNQKTAHFQNPFLIINPKSGNGRATKAHIARLAEEQGIRVMTLQKGDDVGAIASQAAKAGADVLGVSGGDGSIGAVAKVALEHKLPVVVLPGGTKCHFARDIGLDPKRIADALAGFNGVERRIDAGTINGRVFLNNASFGLYADIVDHPDYRDHKLQVSRTILRSIVSGAKDLYDLQFRRGREQIYKAAQVLVGVNRYKTLNVFELGRRERLDEGVLQVTLVTKLTDDTIKHLIKSISIDKLRARAGQSDIDQWETRSFTITNSSGTMLAGVDGEREEYATPVVIRIMPKALSVYVPAEGLRNRPKNAFSWFIVGHLWHSITRGSK